MKQRIVKLLLGPLAYGLGMVLSGMLIAALHFPTFPQVPGETRSGASQFLITLALCPLLTAALLPLAEGMRGKWIYRCVAIAGLLFVTLGLNTVIELTIF